MMFTFAVGMVIGSALTLLACVLRVSDDPVGDAEYGSSFLTEDEVDDPAELDAVLGPVELGVEELEVWA